MCTEESSEPLAKYLLFWSKQPLQNLPPSCVGIETTITITRTLQIENTSLKRRILLV
jgi:hypothetical protein